jgi:hypothetical protein
LGLETKRDRGECLIDTIVLQTNIAGSWAHSQMDDMDVFVLSTNKQEGIK